MAGLLDGATGVLINGEWRPDGDCAPVRDKFTQEPAATVGLATAADAEAGGCVWAVS
jgi:hypothetical protein